MMNALSSMAQTFVIVLKEEKQREVKPHNQTILESTSQNASIITYNGEGTKPFRTNYNSYKGLSSSSCPDNLMFRGSSGTGDSHKQSRSNMFVSSAPGHTKERYYKLNGYPLGSRFYKGKGSASTAHIHSSEAEGCQCEESDNVKGKVPVDLTEDQYEHLINLLGTL